MQGVFVNSKRAGGITRRDTGDFFHFEAPAAGAPKNRFIQQAAR